MASALIAARQLMMETPLAAARIHLLCAKRVITVRVMGHVDARHDPLLRRFWPPALWREIERLREDVSADARWLASLEKFASAMIGDLRAENADLRRRLETQQRRDHRGRFVGSVVKP